MGWLLSKVGQNVKMLKTILHTLNLCLVIRFDESHF